ncbi:hypothetical protein ODV97_19530 [Enterococcus gallinarum]|nr:hypothetical protein [Enterococcus gallinarum]
MTYGPGLVGALLIETFCGKSICLGAPITTYSSQSYGWAHLCCQFCASLEFPLMALLVSGGHTELVYMKKMALSKLLVKHVMMQLVKRMIKSGRVLGLPYPSGKEIDALYVKAQIPINFRAMLKRITMTLVLVA